MNIRWDSSAREFVAEFDDFRGDLEATKEAGFRTNGPPEWRWYAPAPGIKALNRLRENRPASGLTITPEALEIYKPLAEAEAKNEAVKKQLAEAKKKLKKVLKESAKCEWIPVGKEYLDAEDLPPRPPYVPSVVITTPVPTLLCRTCAQAVYFYEYPEIPSCIWCYKIFENNA